MRNMKKKKQLQVQFLRLVKKIIIIVRVIKLNCYSDFTWYVQ